MSLLKKLLRFLLGRRLAPEPLPPPRPHTARLVRRTVLVLYAEAGYYEVELTPRADGWQWARSEE